MPDSSNVVGGKAWKTGTAYQASSLSAMEWPTFNRRRFQPFARSILTRPENGGPAFPLT